MEDMLFKKEQGPHDPVCDLVTEYRAMMLCEQEACISRRKQKEEPPRSNINNKQPFEHAPKIKSIEHKMEEERQEHEMQQTCLRWTQETRRWVRKEGRKSNEEGCFLCRLSSRVLLRPSLTVPFSLFHLLLSRHSKPDRMLLASATCGLVYGGGARAEVNSHRAVVQVGPRCTINGNYCAMIVVVAATGAASWWCTSTMRSP